MFIGDKIRCHQQSYCTTGPIEPRRAGVYGVRAAPGHNRVPAGAMSAARAREMGPGAAAPWPTSVSDWVAAYIAPNNNKTTLLMGADRGALARVRQGHNRAGTRARILGHGSGEMGEKTRSAPWYGDVNFESMVARPHRCGAKELLGCHDGNKDGGRWRALTVIIT